MFGWQVSAISFNNSATLLKQTYMYSTMKLAAIPSVECIYYGMTKLSSGHGVGSHVGGGCGVESVKSRFYGRKFYFMAMRRRNRKKQFSTIN